ncbi:MAG: F0F1 ATP synthase subunit gamma [Gammaproteobacteria bacterium]|nr:MAG: F0F1 ATP synthase subunit gamma [Gammaproteobacteria bacterium]
MPSSREIRTKIKSVQSTQKITSAMEMVATSKMRKAQERMWAARPYAEKIREVARHLGYAHPEYRHPYCEARPIRRVGLIVVTTDRGLCGGLNTNQFRAILHQVRDWQEKGIEYDFCTIGAKGFQFFSRLGVHIAARTDHLGDTPHIQDLVGPVRVMLDAFADQQIDRLYLSYNEFKSTMVQQPASLQLLPCPIHEEVEEEAKELSHYWDYLYEPDAKEVLEELLKRYTESVVYRAVVENIACEQAARMIAMKNATENAGELIEELRLVYNKARQAGITKELLEIVSGAEAL